MCLAIALVAFLVLLFFKMGPWVPGFYMKGTSVASVNQVRDRDPDFDGKKWLKEHPVPPVKPWGALVINLDLTKLEKYLPCLR